MINIININAFYHRLKDNIIEILPTKIVFLNSNPKKNTNENCKNINRYTINYCH